MLRVTACCSLTVVLFLSFLASGPSLAAISGPALFNVRDFGATGKKEDDARGAIQKAVNACAAAGGGTVYLPPGEYTSGQVELRSHVRVYLEAGATLYASANPNHYRASHYAAVFYAESVEKIAVEGRGTVHGQAEYEWRVNDLEDFYIKGNQLFAEAFGKPLMRPFPKGHPTRTVYPRMILFLKSKDIRITGLSFLQSPSWTVNLYACERIVIDGVYIQSSLKEGVWADGIDPDGCKDLRISNSTIQTGDDALVFYSATPFGPALPCEDITVTNCRLSSASSALKFCDGNSNSVRRVTVDNCVITSSNRGIAFMVFDGGYVSDVVLSNLTIETTLFDWFWWGDGDPIHFNIKRRSEIHGQPPKPDEPAAGSIRNVMIRNVIARGKGTSVINGHPDSWLENVSIENVKLSLSADPTAMMQRATDAMRVRWARNLKLKDVEVRWEFPRSGKWQSALHVEDVKGVILDGFSGKQAGEGEATAAVILNQVEDVLIRNATAQEGTSSFLNVKGKRSRGVFLMNSDLRLAARPYRLDNDVPKEAVRSLGNLTP
ncbi:MAG: glycosyl hydrolase family 28 protein [Acidobacteriota bacterium]